MDLEAFSEAFPILLAVIGFTAGVSAVGTHIVATVAFRWQILDIPNSRSSHLQAVPRGGGAALLAAAFGSCAFATAILVDVQWCGWLLGAMALIAVSGLVDDIRGGVPSLLRFAVQLMGAFAIAAGCGLVEEVPLPAPMTFPLGSWALPFTVVWLVAVANFYNFLDGIDGFAGWQGVVAGVTLGWAYWPAAEGWLAFSLAGGCVGFLIHNWHPAKIFMGDAGSATLGFLFAAIPISAGRQGGFDASAGIWLSALALWFFLADGAFTIIRRLLRRERIWEAHRSHLYQRLVQAGWSHARVTSSVGTGSAIVAALAAWAYASGSGYWQWLVMAGATAAFLVYWLLVCRAERRFQRRQPSV